ncbi:tetratricopeptide repeat protein 28-like [Actinia tenebrosa]|uniref:Tetratricopeptide repeat protein 28-like n=1 Tax=Actinia tenebrosa TaxID=6105 RepID=A0A6P8I4V3_ACTTE|nr:tetratricopeptide repeat protein 28-like [Actinia tenebrosa]XP_031562506.1 tetratricopeptide repeat protein 28-like [Actinia tenebrosa]
MEVWKIKLFIRICVLCPDLHHLKEEELICLIEECLVVALFLEDVVTQRISYLLLGTLYKQIHQIERAIEYYKKHLHIANEMGDIKGEFTAYERLANAYDLLGDFREAIKHHKKCLNIAEEMGYKIEEGTAYGKLGNDYQSLGEYHKAIEYHEKCLSIGVEIGDRKIESDACCNLGNAYQSLGKYQKAIEYQEKHLGITIEISDTAGKAVAYGNLGIIYRSLGNYQKAIEYQEKSLDIALSIGQRKLEGHAYGNLGNAYQSLGKYQKATEYLDKCLGIATEIGDKEAKRNAYGSLGNICRSQGKYQEAMEHHKKCLSIVIEIGDRRGEGAAYGDIGSTYKSIGKYPEAIDYFKKRLIICKEIGDRQGEESANGNMGTVYHALGKYHEATMYQKNCLSTAIEIGDRQNEIATYSNLGNAYQSLGKYQKAIKYYEKSLKNAKEITLKREEQVAYGNLGTVYQALGKYHEAIKIHKKSLSIAIEIGDRGNEGVSYGNLGHAYYALKKYHEAKDYYEKRLSIAMEIGDREGEGAAYGSIGTIYRFFANYQKAIEYHEKSLNIAIEIGDRPREGNAYGNLGVAYWSLGTYYGQIEYQEKCHGIAKEIGDTEREGVTNGSITRELHSLEKYQEAIEYHKKHLSIAVEIDDRNGQVHAHLSIGTCYAYLAKLQDSDLNINIMMKKAESHLKKSIGTFESLFDDLDQDQYKISIVETYIGCYTALALVYVETQQTDEALLVSDRGRARALGDLLTLKYSMDKETTSKSAFIQVTDIEMFLSTCNFGILFYALFRDELDANIWVLSHQSPPYFHPSKIKGSISNLVEKSYNKLKVREGIKCEDRSLGLPDVEDQDIENERVSSLILDQNTTKEGESDKVDNKTDARCIYDEDHDTDEKPLELLYDELIAPVHHMLVQDEIVIIPDGGLYMVPFAAFQDPKTGQFLSETKRIRLAPSLATLKVLQESSDDEHDRTGALIVGNPKIGQVEFEGSVRSFIDLPGAEDEAKEIAKLFGVEPLIGSQATKEAVLQKLHVGVSVIHFAAHGSEKNGQILLAPSASSLATNSIPDEEDFVLTMKKVQESGIRAQLVVLSCCHSGRGEIKAEGVVGMSRAFLAAGARAVVASLWAIGDNATKEFMLKFYSHLKRGKSASKSLQQAMNNMRETETYMEPKHWAGFFLIGDDVTISV